MGCSKKCVALIVKKGKKVLIIECSTPPHGAMLPAGHVEPGESYEDAAKRELLEEVGLTAKSIKSVWKGAKKNDCRHGTKYHYWEVFLVEVDDYAITPEAGIVKSYIWADSTDVEALCIPSRLYMTGKISRQEWLKSKCLSLVFAELFDQLEIV